METVADFIFLGSKSTADGDFNDEIKRCLLLGRKAMINLDSILKSRNITLLTRVKAMFFSSSLVWMWELDHKEDWAPKNWCFWTVVLDKTFENPLDNKEIKTVSPKGNQPWRFIERTDAEAEVPIVWPPDVRSQLIGIDPDAGKDWDETRRRRGATEDEMVGWHHWLNGCKSELTPEDRERQGSLGCRSPQGCRVGYDLVTEQQCIF